MFNVIEFYGVVLMMFINAWKQRRIIMEKNIDYYMSLNYRMESTHDEVVASRALRNGLPESHRKGGDANDSL